MDSTYQTFINSLASFITISDAHAVAAILLLTFMVRRTFWTRSGLSPSYVVWVSMGLSFLITPIMSIAPETDWGVSWYFKQCLYNGCASVAGWMLAMPMIVRKWPGLLKDDPIFEGGPK